MEETDKITMEDYKKELERSFRKLTPGDLVTGTIIAISEEELTIDLQYYTQGILPVGELTEDPTFVVDENYQVGDEVTATILKMDDGQGNIILSVKEASQILAWDELRQLQEEERTVTVKVADTVEAGAIAYLKGIRGFIPASQLDITYVEQTREWLGKTLEVLVLTVDQEKNKLVLSARKVLDREQEDKRNKRIASLVPGTVFEGTVESLMPYGAFIQLENGLSGLVHISKISEKRLNSPAEVLKVGEKVKVKLLDVKDHKLSLSIKDVEEYQEADQEEELVEYPNTEELTTSLGSLLSHLKL